MRTFFVLLLVLTSFNAPQASEAMASPPKAGVSGLWLGVMQVGPVNLRMAFAFNSTADGNISGKMLSLDQNRTEIPCQSISFGENKLTIEMPAIAAKYTGRLAVDGNSITGEFVQFDNPVPLNLKRIDKLPTLNRPQHPKKPYPYREEEATFTNPAAGTELAGTLTLPKGKGPFPAVILVTGSGPQDRDQTLFEHKPFLVIADHLTRRGIAVLRFDDRGFGKSGGSFAGSTSGDFASDVHAAMEYLSSRKEVDSTLIGIIGHSEGAIAAEIVAADHPDDVAFIVLLAGFGVSGEKLALAQSTDVVRSAGGSEEDIKLGTDLMEALIPIAKEPGTTEEIKGKLMKAATRFVAGVKDEKVRATLAGSEATIANRLIDPWVRFFLNYDTAKTLGKVKCPVLALAGSRDIQVRSKENLRAINTAVRAGGNQDVTTAELQNLNHLFQTCATGDVNEYGAIEETFSPEALAKISDWVLTKIKSE